MGIMFNGVEIDNPAVLYNSENGDISYVGEHNSIVELYHSRFYLNMRAGRIGDAVNLGVLKLPNDPKALVRFIEDPKLLQEAVNPKKRW